VKTMTEARLQTRIQEALGEAPTLSAPSPRFMGEGTRLALSEVPESFSKPLRTFYRQLSAMEEGPGSAAFDHNLAMGAVTALREASEAVAQSEVSEDIQGAVKEAVGPRFRTIAAHIPPWGRARVTEAFSQRVAFLVSDLRRLLRHLFSGLDDSALSTDGFTGAVSTESVLLHWGRPATDADPAELEVEVRGSLSGRVASGAECAQFSRAVQALVAAADARGTSRRVVLDAADEPGLQRVAVFSEEVSPGRVGADPTASGLVARAFGLEDGAAAESARLVGEQALENGRLQWVRWPRLP